MTWRQMHAALAPVQQRLQWQTQAPGRGPGTCSMYGMGPLSQHDLLMRNQLACQLQLVLK